MATIAVGVGQAGNQILALTARYTGALGGGGGSGHGRGAGGAAGGRAPQPGFLFVDSEPKVVRPLRTAGSPSHLPFIPPDCVVSDHNGRGNNWAWGYTDAASHASRLRGDAGGGGDDGPYLSAQRGKPLASRAMASLRRAAEASDVGIGSLLLAHSTGGGTGSGLGSRLLELVRDAYPTTTLLAAAVAPFEAGDTPLQWYNTCLSLATAVEVADGVLLWDNSDLLRRTATLRAQAASLFGGPAPGASGAARVVTEDLNGVVAQCLAGVLMPVALRRPWVVQATRPARERAAADREAAADAAAAAAAGRPQWHDVSRDAPRAVLAFHNPYARDTGDAEEEGGRLDGDEGSDDGRGRGGGGRGADAPLRPPAPLPFDAAALLADTCPAPVFKLLDVRCAAPMQPPARPLPSYAGGGGISVPWAGGGGGGGMGGDGGGMGGVASWLDLTDMLGETLPRLDRAGRPVTTLASLLVARGASQADCDDVDPSLRGGSGGGVPTAPPPLPTRGTGGLPRRPPPAAGAPPPWDGLPITGVEWGQVSTRLGRAVTFAPAAQMPAGRPQRRALLSPGPVYASPLAPLRQPRSLTLVSNSTVHVPLLRRATERAGAMLREGAYVHWYARFGIDGEHIGVAVERVAEVADVYGAVAPAAARRCG